MQTGDVVANLPALNEHFRLREVDDLIARKREGAERIKFDESDLGAHRTILDRLEAMLDDAHARSSLPEEPTTAAALDDFVVRLRLAGLRESP
jgi:hypothetical protein